LIYVVDTHPLVRFLEANPALGAQTRSILFDPSSQLIVPTIVLAEALYMSSTGRTVLTWGELESFARRDHRVSITDVTIDIVRDLDTILEMHDAIIVATAAQLSNTTGEDVAVITRDRQIRRSGLVQTIW
jgi:predicted nucleic acid-binding protein